MKLLFVGHEPAPGSWPATERWPDPEREVVFVSVDDDLADAIERHAPDLALLRAIRLDRALLHRVELLVARMAGPVLVLVEQDDPPLMAAAIAAGISAYAVEGATPADPGPMLRSAIALSRREGALRQALLRANDALERRVLVDGAKRLLIRHRRMTEPEAHRWLRREAMRGGRPLTEVAAGIAARYGGGAIPADDGTG